MADEGSRCHRTLAAVVLALWLGAAAAADARSQAAAEVHVPVTYAIDVALDPESRTLRGRAELRIEDEAGLELILNRRFELTALVIDGRPLEGRPVPRETDAVWRVPPGTAPRTVTLAWHGPLAATPSGLAHRDTLSPREPTAGARGSFLPAGSLWYPRALRDGEPLLHAYELRIELPAEQHAVVAGARIADRVERDLRVSRFAFPHPGEGIDLIAGPYRVAERPVTSRDGRELALRTYFHDDITALADAYLDATAAYLALYEDWIGPYPYAGFSIVSSPTPTGFGMPTLTYLGIDVLRLPFIRDTSLGHEVLHNWWGNGVYPDHAQGNWAEGLTTFMADYTYAQRRDAQAARAMRLSWLRELSGIPVGADAPLAAFTARRHGVSQAVGYGKAAMLFVMLRERIGTAAFDEGVQRFWRAQRFRVADWDALRTAFEEASGEPLQAFFTQWLTRSGLPEVALEAAVATPAGVRVTLSQAAPAYALDVPLEVDSGDRREMHVVRLDGLRQDFELRVDGAQRVHLDPEHLLLRRFGRGEAPPILRELLFDRSSAAVALGGPDFAAATDALLARLFDHRPGRRAASAIPASTPLLVIGADDEVLRWLARHQLPPPPPEVAGRGDVRMWTLRLPSGAALALIATRDAAALERALRPLPHYGQQSWLVIDDGRAVERGVWPARVPRLEVAHDRGSVGTRRGRSAPGEARGATSR